MIEVDSLTGTDFFDNVFEENLKDRRILINNDINQDIIEKVSLQIIKFNKEDKWKDTKSRKPIYIYINTVGGEVANGFNVIDLIKCSKTPVIGVVLGYAYSMGALMAIATHKTYAFSNSSILIHDGTQGAISSGNKFKDIVKFYDEMDERIKKLVLSNTDISEEFYESKKDREFYFYADEGKNLGVVDGIIGEDIELDEIL